MFNPNLIRIIALQGIFRGSVKCYGTKAFINVCDTEGWTKVDKKSIGSMN